MVSVGWGALISVYMVVFVDFMQLSFLLPLFPKIVDNFATHNRTDFLSNNLPEAMQIGLLGSVAATGEGIAAPYMGMLADRIGRRPVFLISISGAIVCSVVTGFAWTYWPLLIARAVAGICGGTASIAAAYVADVTEPHERASYMTYFQAALFGGLSFGPMIGTAINHAFNPEAACFTAAGICVINLVLVWFFLLDSKTAEERTALKVQAAKDGDISMPCGAWTIFGANFCNGVGFTCFEALGVLYLQDSFFNGDIEPATDFFGIVISGVGIVGLIVNLFLYNRIQPLLGLKGSIAFGGAFSVVAFFCMGIPISKYWFFVWVMLMIFGENFNGTSVRTVITCVVHPSQFGKAMGFMTLFQNVARGIGPFVFTPLYDAPALQGSITFLGARIDWGHCLPWFINSVLKLVAILLCLSVPLLPRATAPAPAPEEGAAEGGSFTNAEGVNMQVEQADDTLKRVLSYTTSGGMKTGSFTTIQRVTSGAPDSQTGSFRGPASFTEGMRAGAPATNQVGNTEEIAMQEARQPLRAASYA